MTLKRFLAIPLVVSIVLFVLFSDEVLDSLKYLSQSITITASLLLALAVAACLQIAGHLIRAYKMRFLLAPVKGSTVRFQFRALSIGYLFNTLLPLKLGELIRAQVIASGEKISFGFALTLIVVERSIDAALLAIVACLFVIFGIFSADASIVAVALGVLSVASLIIVTMIGKGNRRYLLMWHRISALFNDRVKQSLRFKAWTITYGLQRITSRARIVRYIVLTLASWLLYALSMLVVVQFIFKDRAIAEIASLIFEPYYGLALPAGPASLGTFSDVVNLLSGVVSTENKQTFTLIAWAVLIGPVSVLGLIFLLSKTKETLWRRLPQHSTKLALSEKLYRTANVGQELDGFLDNYFSGNNLSQIVHRLELQKDFRLLKYFKGGSDAITILALQNGKTVVKKIIPIEFEDRLKAQYEWLRRHNSDEGIVAVIGEQRGDGYYAIDLEYDDKNEMFFDFMHRSSPKESEQVLAAVWDYLGKSLYRKTKTVSDPKALRTYIDKHIYGCMDKAVAVNKDLQTASEPKRIMINGRKYDNLYRVMKRIEGDKLAMKDLSTFAQSDEVHGDVAVDNILVSSLTGKPLLIDPAPDGNVINGPVFDFGKNMQALYCGYEFLFRGDETVTLGEDGSIRFKDQRSTQYKRLCDYVRRELAPKYLSEGEQRAIIFHAAALHIRRLKHQVYQNPANVLAIYAVGVKTLNDFIAQYDKKSKR